MGFIRLFTYSSLDSLLMAAAGLAKLKVEDVFESAERSGGYPCRSVPEIDREHYSGAWRNGETAISRQISSSATAFCRRVQIQEEVKVWQ